MIQGLLWLIGLTITATILWMLVDIGAGGLGTLNLSFLISPPEDAGRSGGIGPLLVSTLWILAICLAAVIPLGLGAALSIHEYLTDRPTLHALMLRSLDILGAVPSIVFGLFGYAFFAIKLGLGFSILSGGLTLACMALPLFARVALGALESVPPAYRQAASALSVSRTGWMLRILIPQASGGLAAALILAMSRALAETAVLLFTAGYVMRMPDSVLDSGRALAVHIYDLSMNTSGGDATAGATVIVLTGVLLLINGLTRFLLPERLNR
ncbi:phosphate ABC transporter, permease protein PstA [Tamilnaduibacter salinus]|uniref:Phosphate ABC transporter, permease protein PstA n=2 Tax=Tamilnaduibacter salinus TaxID=1484056 RepID=A0A2A2I489_9GAMM|nr:phosphate ABC transporter, permease protein PstA [Tamilnaduibacter salinus]